MKFIHFAFVLAGSASSFLFNTSSLTGTYSNQDLLSLIVEEKNYRHNLETEFSVFKETVTHMQVEFSKELQKERNNRQYLLDQDLLLQEKLVNATAKIEALQKNATNSHAQLEALRKELDQEKTEKLSIFDNIRILQDRVANLTAGQMTQNSNVGKVSEHLANVTTEMQVQSKTYQRLLEQFVSITTANHELDRRLTNLNATVANISISGKGHSVGFTLRSVDKDSSQAQHLKFLEQIFDTGDTVDTTTGDFVCHRAGLYLFVLTIVREPGILQSYCTITVNNVAMLYTVSQGSNVNSFDGYPSGTTALVYHLGTNDRVGIKDCHGVDHMYAASSFSGVLIAPDS